MNRSTKRFATVTRAALAAVALGLAPLPAQGGATDLADVPMAVASSVKANFLVVLDNSQSMDGNMAGVVQSGDNPDTRSNIGRGVLRDVLGAYRNTFRWGLMSFATSSLELRWPLAEYMGSDEGLAFTDDCVGGISASHGNRRCIANPQASLLENSGDKYVTYDKSGDDLDVLDVLYWQSKVDQMWAFTPETNRTTGANIYSFWQNHQVGTLAWAASEFSTGLATLQVVATDAGFMPTYPTTSRMLLLLRGWGYRSSITGGGNLVESVQSDSTEHYANLIKSLVAETSGGSATPEIKNGATYTPLAGTLESAKSYFFRAGRLEVGQVIQQSDQRVVPEEFRDVGNRRHADRRQERWALYQRPTNRQLHGLERRRDGMRWCMDLRHSLQRDSDRGRSFALGPLHRLRRLQCFRCSDLRRRHGRRRRQCACRRGNERNGSARWNRPRRFLRPTRRALRNAIEAATRNAEARTGAAAAVAVSNAIVTKDTVSFQSTYYSGNWTGDLKAYELDTETGALATFKWSAQAELAKRTASERKIASYNGSDRGVRFQPSDATGATLSSEQQALVSVSDGAGIVNFIRGDRSGETATADTAQKYRRRTSLLGDIINSEPVFVTAPAANYSETTNLGYAAFKILRASRPPLVFQGANDGMLHAFKAASGDEAWAYVPSIVLPTLANLPRLTDFAPQILRRWHADRC